MPLSPTELRDVHAMFGGTATIVDRRRAIYSAVVELAADEAAADDRFDVLDSPAVRAHLASVINGGAYRADAMISLSRFATRTKPFTPAGWRTAIIDDPAADTALHGVVAHLAANLGVSAGRDKGIRLLLEPDPGFPAASALVVAGLELAASISSSLVDDLLPHVAGFAMITGAEHGRLGSASLRDYPGLIVLPRPSSALEVAEALVHEGAHQLLFDLCVTCTMLGTSDSATPTFRPSWSPASRPTWPLAQALAAFHAYTCLATFFQLINASDASTVVHDSSLLPQAAQRADEIGGWLVHHSEHLGTDGRDFVRLLRGTTELLGRGSRRGDEPGVIVDFQADASRPTAVRDCGEWTLVARRGSSIELFWIKSTAG